MAAGTGRVRANRAMELFGSSAAFQRRCADMTAYLIVDVDVHDEEAYAEYVRRVPALVEKHSGTYLVRGGAAENAEGDWQPSRMVVIAFADTQTARGFLDDPEYALVKAIRHRVATSRGIIVEGV